VCLYLLAMAQHKEELNRAESAERHQRANYTYEWIHTQVRHGNSPVPDIGRCVLLKINQTIKKQVCSITMITKLILNYVYSFCI